MILCCMFWCQSFGDVSHNICSYYFFSSVWVAEWPPFGKQLLTRLTICFHCILTIGFEGWIWVLLASVPRKCVKHAYLENMYYNTEGYFGH